MMNHFKPKTLLFYAVVIGSTVTLFQVVAAYGERTLKAPPNINGRYVSTAAPPGCAADDRLVLEIQQSGIYLNGSLMIQKAGESAPAAAANSEKRPPLSGLWQQNQVALSGKTETLAACAPAQATQASAKPIDTNIQGQITPEKQFVGQLTLDAGGQPWQFQAERKAEPKGEKSGH